MGSALAGLLAGWGLIVAIGAQNAFVLRQGLRREHVAAVVAICAASDVLLIAVGIAGLGVVFAEHPGVVTAVRWVGAVFLLGYALLAARRAWRPAGLTPLDAPPAGLRATLLTCLALTYLNPHVYLDTVLLLGAIGRDQPQPWAFGAGAATGSAAWFTVLGAGARRLAPLLARPAAWRVLDGAIALVMAVLAVSLVTG